MNPFKQDVIDLFTKKRGGHVEHWLFSDTLRRDFTGSQLWQEFLKASTDYYVLKNEVRLIEKTASKLATALPPIKTIVDFGVGSGAALEQKIKPLIQKLNTIQSYIGIDISKEFLKNARQFISVEYPNFKTTAIHKDFFKTSFALPSKDSLGLMLGSTITNMDTKIGEVFPRSHIVSRLKHLKHLIGKDNHLLISYDANTDVDSIMAAYTNEYWGRHVTGIMFDVAGFTEGSFSPSDWKHSKVWNNQAYVLHNCAEATKDMRFSIDSKQFNISKGERFVTVNNFKFPIPLFQALCDDAGFQVKESYSDHQNRMQLQLLKA